MSFREFSHRILEPASIWAMVLGIVFLCQPWIAFLHQWSVIVMLIGFIGFNVAVHVPKPESRIDEDDTGPTSLREAIGEGRGHG